MKNVLWIEDSAFVDLTHLYTPVYVSGKYNLVVALDASDGSRKLMNQSYDAVIVDIRIPPGDSPDWIKLYETLDKDKTKARLGLKLLYRFLKPGEGEKKKISWIKPERFGIFTIESDDELRNDIETLGIKIFQQKTAGMPYSTLLDLIEKILSQKEIK